MDITWVELKILSRALPGLIHIPAIYIYIVNMFITRSFLLQSNNEKKNKLWIWEGLISIPQGFQIFKSNSLDQYEDFIILKKKNVDFKCVSSIHNEWKKKWWSSHTLCYPIRLFKINACFMSPMHIGVGVGEIIVLKKKLLFSH